MIIDYVWFVSMILFVLFVEAYITVALGVRSAFHRDAMIYQTLSKIMNSDIQNKIRKY